VGGHGDIRQACLWAGQSSAGGPASVGGGDGQDHPSSDDAGQTNACSTVVSTEAVSLTPVLIASRSVALALLLGFCAQAQQLPPAVRGNWVATVGPTQTFRGRWSGQVSPQNKNAAAGSWTLLGDHNQIVLEGTWSAQKNSQAWRGTWSARIVSGRSFSGTWTADLSGFKGKTFEEMLSATLEKQVSGSWRSGRYQGDWWLTGLR
jgi:hypothetical protein